MSNASMTFGRPTRLTIPRGSLWLGTAAAWLIRQLQHWDRSLLSARPEEPRSAEEVLAWASRIEATEPGFAADLRAAALRSQDANGQ